MIRFLERFLYRIDQFRSAARLEGWDVAIFRSVRVLGRSLGMKRIHFYQKPKMKDLLFVNGCSLDHCRRYRVLHPMEQLSSLGFQCQEKFYEDLTLEDLKYYRGFIFYRTAATPLIEEFIKIGRSWNKAFFFDVDDLVIDTQYTDGIGFLKTLPATEKELYDSGVHRIQATLKLCDAAITTTPVLAQELKRWHKDIFINPNVASDEMVSISEAAFVKSIDERKATLRNPSIHARVKLGFLSGSISHNPDLELISPALAEILRTFPNVELRVVGLVEVPTSLRPFSDRITRVPLAHWKKVPAILAKLDINLAPLEDTLFNQAKSENRWMEAAWLRVPTISSRVGRFAEVIRNGLDGMLCENTTAAWVKALSDLIQSSEMRQKIGYNAYSRVSQEYHTLKTGIPLAQFIQERLKKNIGFVLPMIEPRGGINVVIQHAHLLKKNGYDVTLLAKNWQQGSFKDKQGELPIISLKKAKVYSQFDQLIATLWSTVEVVQNNPRAIQKKYLVQGYEVDFMPPPNPLRAEARATYRLPGWSYLTISKWCQGWLKGELGTPSRYAPNGIDLTQFQFEVRNFDAPKWRILIEGDSLVPLKNVDESFRIIEKLPTSEFEVWYLSYDGRAKSWYRVDQVFQRVPYTEVSKIYQQCHVLIKTSIFESFSYPPLEMMATGGLVVARENGGNQEFLRHRENCMLYKGESWEMAVEYFKELKNDPELRARLVTGGLETAKKRNWTHLEKEIVELYQGTK